MTDGEGGKRGVEAECEPNFLLAPFERRFLPWAARRLPRWVLPDDTTVFDVIGLGIVAVMVTLLTVRVFGNLRELAKEEPSATRR